MYQTNSKSFTRMCLFDMTLKACTVCIKSAKINNILFMIRKASKGLFTT